MGIKTGVKAITPSIFREQIGSLSYRLKVLSSLSGEYDRECPICDYKGKFSAYGLPPRYDAHCKGCGSLERHRLLWLVIQQNDLVAKGADVIHFAPEETVTRMLKPITNYKTADIRPGAGDLVLDMEVIDLPDNSVDVFVANHVLEHVDDKKALGELLRTLKPGGIAIITVPIIEGWAQTYENVGVSTEKGRSLHFGQWDHVRYYGRDIRDRIRAVGFDLTEYYANGVDSVRYGLGRGDCVFICTKPKAG